MSYRKDIQGLRAIAILSVFLFHLNSSWLPGGFTGVDIFFVISGFLICSRVLYKIDRNNFSLIKFYKNRVQRIVPAYYILLLVVALVGVNIFIISDIHDFRKAYFWSFIFDSNNFFATQDTYFGASSNENPFLHTWTLAIEMKLHFLSPLILLFVKRKWLFTTILLSTIILFTYTSVEIFVNNNRGLMYFSLWARIPEFFIGFLASILYKRTIQYRPQTGMIMSVIGLMLLVVSILCINGNSYFPGLLSLVPCVGTVLLLLAPVNPIRSLLSSKALLIVGKLSYSIYLWHWPIMAFMRYYYNTYTFSSGQIVFIISLTVVLSVLSYYYVEKIVVRIKTKSFWLLILSLLGINVLVFFSIFKINKEINSVDIEYLTPTFGLESHGNTFKNIEILGDTLSNVNNILLIGDSHALSMKSYFDYLGKQNAFSVKTITNERYSPIPGLEIQNCINPVFYDQYSNLLQYSEPELEKADIIIMQYHVLGDYIYNVEWIEIIENFIKHLQPHQSFILLSDFPTLDKNPVKINREIVKDPNRSQSYKLDFGVPYDIIELLKSYPNAYYLDLSGSKVFEDAPFYNDTLMYYDRGHLNIYGARVYAQDTENKLMDLLQQIKDKQN